jgi:DNA-binding beta-propeller fold protein YncE
MSAVRWQQRNCGWSAWIFKQYACQLALLTLAAGQFFALAPRLAAQDFDATTETVGHGTNGVVTPVNQRLTPAGTLLELPGMRPEALALSPNGKLLVTSGITHELVVINPATGRILQHVAFPPDPGLKSVPGLAPILDPDDKAQISFTGLVFSPDGSRIYVSNVNGNVKVFNVAADGKVTTGTTYALPLVHLLGRDEEIPAGLAVSADGRKLYVALNLSNRLVELDTATGKILRSWDVGVAPFGVALVGDQAYVSNWGGRRPAADSLTAKAGHGTRVRVDERDIASEGSVSVIHLTGTNQTEILTGLHTSALAVSPNGHYLVAANAGSDTLSVIDTRSDQIDESICTRQSPGDAFGAQPNALAFDPSGRKLFVCNGTQNAVAVVNFRPFSWIGLKHEDSQLLGLIPTGWFPSAIVYDPARRQLCVANLKGLTRGRLGDAGKIEFNTKQHAGSLSFIPLPSASELAGDTATALADLRYPLLALAKLPPRPGQPAQPVPVRVGEPSVFQHVVYVIKENRTYDQVLGDVATGDGSPALCTFGARVTPNEHAFVDQFVLLDNLYCCGVLSADGHNWADSGIATDYVERSFAGWPRSYPAGGGGDDTQDALAWSPAGFIWNDAAAHGRTIADFGEYTTATKKWKNPARKKEPNFLECYRDFLSGSNAIAYSCEPDIAALRPYMMTNTIGWDLDVPDVWRAAQFIKSLKQFEAAGTMPNLIILWLPNDHTDGAKPGAPTPAAHVADNDLAFGQVVEALSHSIFWTNTCVFGVEDDPQNGWDHVSGYRTTAYVVSPYTKRHTTVSTQYNQTSLLRTMELILGLPPMNQMDATATPMFDCFTNTPDFTAFTAVPNQVPLDKLNTRPEAITDPILRQDAQVSARLNFKQEDQCPEDLLNRILWRSVKGSQVPYPEWAVKVVDDD